LDIPDVENSSKLFDIKSYTGYRQSTIKREKNAKKSNKNTKGHIKA